MSQTYVSRRTSTPDAASGNLFAVIASNLDTTILFPMGIMAQNNIGEKPAIHRSGLTALDANTDMSTGDFASGLFDLNNDSEILVWAESSVTLSILTLVPIYYDQVNRPLFEGAAITLGAGARRVQAAGNYLTCLQQLRRAPGADKVKLLVTQVSAGSWNLYLASI